jgi:hypothetical protein
MKQLRMILVLLGVSGGIVAGYNALADSASDRAHVLAQNILSDSELANVLERAKTLIRFGLIDEAYAELQPMVARVANNHGFYEWWSLKYEPRGSGQFRGSAGVLGLATQQLRSWAEATGSARPGQDKLPARANRGP